MKGLFSASELSIKRQKSFHEGLHWLGLEHSYFRLGDLISSEKLENTWAPLGGRSHIPENIPQTTEIGRFQGQIHALNQLPAYPIASSAAEH